MKKINILLVLGLLGFNLSEAVFSEAVKISLPAEVIELGGGGFHKTYEEVPSTLNNFKAAVLNELDNGKEMNFYVLLNERNYRFWRDSYEEGLESGVVLSGSLSGDAELLKPKKSEIKSYYHLIAWLRGLNDCYDIQVYGRINEKMYEVLQGRLPSPYWDKITVVLLVESSYIQARDSEEHDGGDGGKNSEHFLSAPNTVRKESINPQTEPKQDPVTEDVDIYKGAQKAYDEGAGGVGLLDMLGL